MDRGCQGRDTPAAYLAPPGAHADRSAAHAVLALRQHPGQRPPRHRRRFAPAQLRHGPLGAARCGRRHRLHTSRPAAHVTTASLWRRRRCKSPRAPRGPAPARPRPRPCPHSRRSQPARFIGDTGQGQGTSAKAAHRSPEDTRGAATARVRCSAWCG